MSDNCSYLQEARNSPQPAPTIVAQLHETPLGASASGSHSPAASAGPARPLSALPDGARGTVVRVAAANPDIDAASLRRLGEIGFLPGEPVQVMRRGPGGREPIAVVIGETMFGLRLLEAQSIEVEPHA